MADTPIPPISKALVTWLNRLFPNQCPNLEMMDREIWFQAGQADVVRKLKHEHDKQATSVLEN